MMKIFIFSLLVVSSLVSQCQGKFYCTTDSQCQNGGTCIAFTCSCVANYYGEKCEYHNECYPACPPGTSCYLKVNKTVCDTRPWCSDRLPCKHGGICDLSTGECTCPLPYHGPLCKYQYECDLECEIGEVCYVLNDTKTCIPRPCASIADIFFVLDFSGSIGSVNFEIMKNTVVQFVQNFDIGLDKIRVGLLRFNRNLLPGIINLDLHGTKAALVAAINGLPNDTGGTTRTDKALQYLIDHAFTPIKGGRLAAPNVALVLTDGKSTNSAATTTVANALKNTDINVITIGIGTGIDEDELKLIASRPENVFLTNFTSLPDIVEALVNTTCVCLVNPCADNPCENGGTCEVFLTGYICHCVESYIGLNCEIKCDITGDFMIALDESGSITQANFDRLINTVMYFISIVDILNGKVRIGIITFAANVIVHYDLDAFLNKLDLLFVTNMLKFQYIGGVTHTHMALKYLRQHSFTAPRGDRLNYPNFAFIFTDGKSRYPWETKKEARRLHRSGVSIYAFGVGTSASAINKREMYAIASPPKRHHYIISTYILLPVAIRMLIMRICEDLRPLRPCMCCKHNCNCPPGMICCRGCCIDSVSVLS